MLPELGIHDVKITTFARWAIQTLGIGDHFYNPRPGRDEAARDGYEWAKLKAMRKPFPAVTAKELKRPDRLLMEHYSKYLDAGQMGLLHSELEEGAVDRYDLTLLLMMKRQSEGRLMAPLEVRTAGRGGRVKIEITQAPLEYSMILVDEFQNLSAW